MLLVYKNRQIQGKSDRLLTEAMFTADSFELYSDNKWLMYLLDDPLLRQSGLAALPVHGSGLGLICPCSGPTERRT